MFRDRFVLSVFHLWVLGLGSGLALGGCATAPAPAKQQWIAMSLLTPAAADPDAPWFPRAASLMLRNELAAIPGLMVVACQRLAGWLQTSSPSLRRCSFCQKE